jgi:hypothetical protein
MTVIGTGDGVVFSPAVLFRPQSDPCVLQKPDAASSNLVTTSAADVPMLVDLQTVMAAHVDWGYHSLSRGAARRRPRSA